MSKQLNRRQFMEKSLIVSGSVAAGLSFERQALLANSNENSAPSAAEEPITGLQKGRIGKLEISRLICGGNLFSGFAHARELIYASKLMKTYFTPEKIMDTLQLCEENGINAAILRCDDHIAGVIDRYRKERGGKIQWIAQTYPKADNLTENIQKAIDNGAVGAYMQGGIGDDFVQNDRLDLIGEILSFIKQNGLIAGVGSHSLEVPIAVEREKLEPDFYFKTFNSVDYNSEDPRVIGAFMENVDKPWIAFKVLGAGAVEPREGFELAYRMGADFLNVGMFDFQVREDIVHAKELLAGELKRERPWRS